MEQIIKVVIKEWENKLQVFVDSDCKFKTNGNETQ